MQWAIAFFIAMYLLCTCQKEERSSRAAQEARIEQEVKERVEQEVAIEQKTNVRQAELRTYRVAGFVLITSGALACLFWLQRTRSYVRSQPRDYNLQVPAGRGHFPVPTTRVFDLQPPASSNITRAARRVNR